MKILALDTSTDACSAAILVDDSIVQRFEIAPQKHTVLILPMVQSLLAETNLTLHNLDAIAFGCGPGSFTGVRLAVSITQGLAFGADLKVIPVSSLQTVAQGVYEQYGYTSVVVAQDARMQEVYWGAYQLDNHGRMRSVVSDALNRPTDIHFHTDNSSWIGVGNGWQVYAEQLRQNIAVTTVLSDAYPQARYIAKLAVPKYEDNLWVLPEDAAPVYLRDEVAWK